MARKLPPIPLRLWNTLNEVLSIPTAPFAEFWLRDALRDRLLRKRGISLEIDGAGNMRVRYRPKCERQARFAFQAHLDHPGFLYVGEEKGRGIAEILGGVSDNIKRAKVRFFSSPYDNGSPATITGILHKEGRRFALVKSDYEIEPQSIGMWEFPALRKRGDFIEGRAFDDTLGVAVLVYLLEEASRKGHGQAFDVLFTRAEEVGYVGTLALLREKLLVLPPAIITIEMPNAYGELVPGDGVMIRGGDRYIGFDPWLTLYFSSAAEELAKELGWFRSQRRLGLGGGTEVTAFELYGFSASAVCLAVENGHNSDRRRQGRPAPERVHRCDLLSLVSLLTYLLSRPFEPALAVQRLKERLEKGAEAQRRRLDVLPS